jgi:hypothetical protein
MRTKYLVVFQIDNLFTKPLMRTIIECTPQELEEHIYKIEAEERTIAV